MKVHCMRHGQSEYNILGLCNDDPARNVRLTKLGRKQAEWAADKVMELKVQRIYCSRLPRAKETANIVAELNKLPVDPRAGLNDIRSGCDGKPVEEYFRLIGRDRYNTRVGEGETLKEHRTRVRRFINWLKKQPYDEVLVVAHEETLRVFKAYAEGLSIEEMLALNFANCEIYTFELG